MGNMTLRRWVEYAPDLGNNRDLPEAEQMLLEIATALTSEQLSGVLGAISKTKWSEIATIATVLEPFVKLQPGHSIDGKALETLGDLFAVACSTSTRGAGFVAELQGELVRLNTVEGDIELFSQRRSGGLASTAARSAAPKGSQTATP